MMKTKKMTYVTMLAAIAILFHMIEGMIPIPLPVPGFKLGLANIVGLIALYMFDDKTMIGINLMRVLLASLLRGIIYAGLCSAVQRQLSQRERRRCRYTG